MLDYEHMVISCRVNIAATAKLRCHMDNKTVSGVPEGFGWASGMGDVRYEIGLGLMRDSGISSSFGSGKNQQCSLLTLFPLHLGASLGWKVFQQLGRVA